MARNRVDQDEQIKRKFDSRQMRRVLGYVHPYRWKMSGILLLVLAASTILNTIYFLKTVITLYRPPIDGAANAPRARVKASFAVSLVCLIAANFFLGTFSQPIIEAIRAGLNMFA